MAVTDYTWDVANDSYLMESDENGDTVAEYTNEPGQYGPLVSERRSEATSTYHFDAQHSTRQLTDEGETVTDTATYTYTAFGQEITSAGATIAAFRYNGAFGYYFAAETETVYVRARSYVPLLARWASSDPLRFLSDLPCSMGESRDGRRPNAGAPVEDGVLYDSRFTNSYEYSDGNPILFSDPSGLMGIKFTWANHTQRMNRVCLVRNARGVLQASGEVITMCVASAYALGHGPGPRARALEKAAAKNAACEVLIRNEFSRLCVLARIRLRRGLLPQISPFLATGLRRFLITLRNCTCFVAQKLPPPIPPGGPAIAQCSPPSSEVLLEPDGSAHDGLCITDLDSGCTVDSQLC